MTVDFDDWISALYARVDTWLRQGEFAACDAYLASLDLSGFAAVQCVAVLSITLAARHELCCRPALVERVEARLLELAPDRIAGLMDGLR